MSTTFQLAVWRLVLLVILDNTDRSWSTKMQTCPCPFHDASSYEGLSGRQSLPTSTMSGILSGRATVYPEACGVRPDRTVLPDGKDVGLGTPEAVRLADQGAAAGDLLTTQHKGRLAAVRAHDEVPAVRDGEAVVQAADAGGADVEACAEEVRWYCW